MTAMANVLDTRTARLIEDNTDIAPAASNSKRILRCANPSFQTAFANPYMSRNADIQVETLEQSLESNDKSSPSPLEHEPRLSAARSAYDFLTSAKFRAIVQLMAQEEVERNYANRFDASTTRAVEEVHSDAFQFG